MQTRVRQPTVYGTCQVCGGRVAVAAKKEAPTIQRHGHVIQRGGAHIPSLACAGSGYPPLEASRERAEGMRLFYRQQLEELRARNRAVVLDLAPSGGLQGAAALRARFTRGIDGVHASSDDAQQRHAQGQLQAKISNAEKHLGRIENLLLTGPSIAAARKDPPAERVDCVFRRTRDSKVYIVEAEEAPIIRGHGRNQAHAPTYRCRPVDGGQTIRITANELTRALNEQGLPPSGEPTQAAHEPMSMAG